MDLYTCRETISLHIHNTATEKIPLDRALYRITAKEITALIPQPEFNQSMRDGFVLGNFEKAPVSPISFPVKGLIQAGSLESFELKDGQACRIMTGGKVPPNGVRVIPQEDCTVQGECITVPVKALRHNSTFIQIEGSETSPGTPLVAKGTELQPDHISLIASAGIEQVTTFKKPQVAYFCTGSELVDSAKELKPGLKISSNRYLLDGLIRCHGGEPHYLGTVSDSDHELEKVFTEIKEKKFDMAISTGGMGPGKYDLIQKGFTAAGGTTIYNRLNLRPGKDSLFGPLNTTLFFGLPGPPNAVRALMSTLVGPTLQQMQGERSISEPHEATLLNPVIIKRKGVMQLMGGHFSLVDGQCVVQPAQKREAVSCYLIISADKAEYAKGEKISILIPK